MRKIILGVILFFAALGPCFADSQGSATGGTVGTQSTLAGCIYQSSPSTLSNNQQTGLSCGTDHSLNVTDAGAAAGIQAIIAAIVAGYITPPLAVQGNVASGATDSGNPVKIGCKYNLTLPTFTDGQRGDCQTNNFGGLIVGSSSTPADGATNAATLLNQGSAGVSASSRPLSVFPWKFNGSTWDRDFTCSSSAVVNVTAGNTTEIVALTASQVIRVCSFTVAMSVTGSAQWVYGTGTNCGSGTTNLTGDMPLLTATPWTYGSNATGGSVMRTASANALCMKATTGNVIGIVTYAKY